jgi:4-hydroxyacetophenone monooxygenase
MELHAVPEPVDADADTIAAALADTELPPLLATVAQVTGDLSLLRADLAPDPMRMLEPDAGIEPEQLAAGRRLATEALLRFRAAGSVPAPPPTAAALRQLVEFVTGGGAIEAYLPLLEEELALTGDQRAPAWNKAAVDPDRAFTVAIIGAGMSGIVAAHRLQQAGVPFVIFDKNEDVGGTWFENTYPGCRVDVPNHFYSYSFAQTCAWPQFFSTQDVLLDYFRTCVDQLGLRDHIRFGTEVLGAEWDDDAQRWTVDVRNRAGEVESVACEALVSATGQLNRPSYPAIPGRERFEGESFHSAEWDHDVALAGRTVAVIGTGASAAQFVPHVAAEAAELLVFQRTPPWLIPTPNYQDDLPEGLRWVLRHLPTYAQWDRLWVFWKMHESLLPACVVDPSWEPQERSVSVMNDMVRELFTAFMREEFTDDDLLAKVLPQYPPVSKRVVRDNGAWARTLTADNVELITDPIAEITPHGVRTADGVEHRVDVIVYGTGFEASKFLTPMQVTGRDGVDLHEHWDGEARAYLGVTVPGFPNLFLMYGPNTNIVINGSIIFFSECEAHYILECVRLLLESGATSLEPRVEVHDEYNARVDAMNRQMAWGASSVNSWYKNASGRVTQNWPFSLLDYWQQTRVPDPDDYVVRAGAALTPRGT